MTRCSPNGATASCICVRAVSSRRRRAWPCRHKAARMIDNFRATLGTALRLVFRDLRVILFNYKVLVLSIAIGVAAVTGVAALTDSFLNGLARDGRALVGGDISFARAQEPFSVDERH